MDCIGEEGVDCAEWGAHGAAYERVA